MDVIFPTGITNGTPATDDRLLFSDTSDSGATKDCAIDSLPVSTAGAAAIAVVQADIDAHEARTDNPHMVTKTQVGLWNVDNTADTDKPISNLTQTALNAKQATLVSGTNIKTINGSTILGSGDITISGGSGDVVGPGSAFDNSVVRFNGSSGKLVQVSGASIDDLGNFSTSGTITGSNVSGTNTGDQVLPTRASLGLDTTDTVTFANLSGTNTGDQDLSGYALKAGTTFTGDVVLDSAASAKRLILDADNNVPRIMSFRTDNLPRWALRVDGNETGSNEGGDFAIRRYDDTGVFIDAPISIDRSTGDITTSQDFVAGGNVSGANFSPTFLSETNQVTGMLNNTAIGRSYSHANRTITLTGTIEYYWKGIKKTLSSGWVSSAHTATNGGWFLYSSDGTNFVWSQTPWDFGYVMVAYVWYQPTEAQSFGLNELHGLMDSKSHEEFHQTFGTYRRSGGTLTAGTYTENTATNVATTPGFDSAVIKDEDIETTVPAWTEGSYTQMYVGAANTCVFVKGASYPFTETGSFLKVNNPTTGAMTDGINGRWYNVYQILLPTTDDAGSQTFRMIMLQPQATHASLAAALAEDTRTMNLGNFANLATEWVIYARITYVTANGDTNAGKCRIATGGVTYVTGTRAGTGTISGYSPTDHSGLTNLTWTTSGHTGTATRIAGFADTTGVAAEVTTGTGLSLASNTLAVTETPALKSATTTVNVSSATAPSSGQVLTATSSTAATWQTPAAGGSVTAKLADYAGSSSIGIMGIWTFDTAKTLSKFALVAESIPVGSNLIIELRKNSTSSGNILSSTLQITTADSLTNGQKYVTTTGFTSASVSAGDYVVAYLTSVGSTTPSINVSSYLTFS